MAATNHKDYDFEKERLEYTNVIVEQKIAILSKKTQVLDNETLGASKNFDFENSQGYIDMMVKTNILVSEENTLKNMIKVRDNPYFARIDFVQEDKKSETLYIGKASVIREDKHELIVIDWRAPVSSLYYEERIGDASYDSPDGKIEGQLRVKRQFVIKNKEIHDIFDLDVVANDTFLQACLGSSADSRLKEIVSTIQAEQNRIIRAAMWTPLIVQGVAGSGKTTIALHRIAYLVYNYEKTFKPENFMILAPNRLFLDYISTVLPELGVENISQKTFEDLAVPLIKDKFKLKGSHERLFKIVEMTNEAGRSEDDLASQALILHNNSHIKTTIEFKNMLDRYLLEVEQGLIPDKDLYFGTFPIFEAKMIKHIYNNEYKKLPFMKRFDEIKKYVLNSIQRSKDKILNHFESNCYKEVAKLKETMADTDKRQNLIIAAYDKRDAKVKGFSGYSKKSTEDFIKSVPVLSPILYYKNFIENITNYATNNIELYTSMAQETLSYLKEGFLEYEDLSPCLYIRHKVWGFDFKNEIKHLVIDEAQDFGVFQMFLLKEIFKNTSFTILGDLNQGIYSFRGVGRWEDVSEHVFNNSKVQYLELIQCYRTTIEIMNAANIVISKVSSHTPIMGRPVLRHGDKVSIDKKGSEEEILKDILEQIIQLQKKGYVSISVVTRTGKDSQRVYKALKNSIKDINLVVGKEDTYLGGISIMPVYLSKGLEFDACIIENANSKNYKNDSLDVKLLYVAMTRALHVLKLYHTDEASSLLDGIEA